MVKGYCREGERKAERSLALNMLPKKNRLKKKKDFEQLYRRGKGFKQDFLFLKVNQNNLKDSRIGIVVGLKATKKAVERNLIKRRLREGVRKRLPEIKPGLDIMIVGLTGVSEKISFQDIKQTLDKLLVKSKIVKQEFL